jgi:DNA-binding transcriptional ArsR family regulator
MLNSMMDTQVETTLDQTFAALADPTRRALLAQLGDRSDTTVGELAKPFAMSLPAVMKHLDVLERAGLLERQKIGRSVHCRLVASPMEDAMQWLAHYEQFWRRQLNALAKFVEAQSEEERWPSQARSINRPVSPSGGKSKRRPRRSLKP